MKMKETVDHVKCPKTTIDEIRNGNSLPYSCLENPMNRGAWQSTGQGVAKELDMTQETKQ